MVRSAIGESTSHASTVIPQNTMEGPPFELTLQPKECYDFGLFRYHINVTPLSITLPSPITAMIIWAHLITQLDPDIHNPRSELDETTSKSLYIAWLQAKYGDEESMDEAATVGYKNITIDKDGRLIIDLTKTESFDSPIDRIGEIVYTFSPAWSKVEVDDFQREESARSVDPFSHKEWFREKMREFRSVKEDQSVGMEV